MKFKLSNILTAFSEVFSKPLHLIISVIVAVLIFSFNLLIINYRAVFEFFNFKFIIGLIIGTFNSMLIYSQIILVIISVMTGILVSLLSFKLKYIKETFGKGESTGIFGAIFGVLVPACSSCGLGLIALLGYTSLIVVLPFRGVELGVIGIVLLLFAIYYLSNQIVEKHCKVKEKK